MQTPIPLTKDLVLIGGGHTHALVLRHWGMKPLPGVRLTLINPGPTAPYSGMLPGFVAGHYTRKQLDIDLVRLARFAGARWIVDRAVGIDKNSGHVILQNWPPIAYDIASVDIGITSDLPELPGFTAHAVPAKPLGNFASRWDRFVQARQAGPVVILGGGVAGAELAMACAHRLGRGDIALIDRGQILKEFGHQTRNTLLKALKSFGIRLYEGQQVTQVKADKVVLATGETLDSALTIGAAGAKAQDWLADTGLALQDGFITVDSELRSSDPSIYAVGDCAHLAHAPRPKAGVFAVREAPILANNLRADLSGRNRKAYQPQRDYLKLISLGGKKAIADKKGLRVAGPSLWRLKDKIDRKFMDRFTSYPTMAPESLPAEVALGVVETLGHKPLCGGCGAKVSAGTLDSALLGLPKSKRTDVVASAGDDAAVLQIGTVQQVISTDHLRALTDDPYVMSKLAIVHALGDVWAMGAQPQITLSTVILPRMSETMQAETLREITAGALSILDPLGAELVGGHTTLGPELTLGFSVTGLVPHALTQSGARVGDRLILTRPIGTGVVLAGEMQMLAHGADVAALLRQMAEPQSQAALILAKVATAMTDVTGFGLIGHLARMAAASGVGAVLQKQAVPFYSGAEALAACGVKSSLYPSNKAQLPDISETTPKDQLLFDPQTCGGLLASVPAEQADAVCDQINGAVVIGEITKNLDVKVQ